MGERRSIVWSIVSKILWTLVFIALVFVVNLINYFIQEPILNRVTGLLNANLILIILLAVFFFLAELFSIFRFPLNVPYPIFNGVGAVLLTVFIFRVAIFTLDIFDLGFAGTLSRISTYVYPVIFVIVLAVGLYTVLSERRR